MFGSGNNMSDHSYIYPALGGALDCGFFRLGGAGLGNLLLSWGRSTVVSETLGIPMLVPCWKSMKIGPMLRGERDSRRYAQLFVPDRAYLHGLNKARAFAGIRHVQRFVDPSEVTAPRPNTLLIPRPHQIAPEYFVGMFQHRTTLLDRLVDMTHPAILHRVAQLPPVDVAVHIRLGDFATFTGQTAPNTRLPLEWYADRMDAIRRARGPDTRFVLFSDGEPDQLAPLMGHQDVSLRSGEAALVDLYSIAGAQMLIASASTFSLWGCFLGAMPSIWFPGGLLQTFPDRLWLRIESPFGSSLPDSFHAGAGQGDGVAVQHRILARAMSA